MFKKKERQQRSSASRQGAGAAAGALHASMDPQKAAGHKAQKKDQEATERACRRQKKKAKHVEQVVAQLNRTNSQRGGAWVLVGSDRGCSQGQRLQGQRLPGASGPECGQLVKDHAGREHDHSLDSWSDGEGANLWEDQEGADGDDRTGRGAPVPHGGGSAACCPGQPVLIGGEDTPHAEYVFAAKRLFDESSCPPRLHCSLDCRLKTAAFAMPDWKEDKRAVEWGRLHVTGVCKLSRDDSADSGSQGGFYVYFCSCNEAGQTAWNMCLLFGCYNASANNAGITSADCLHVQALPFILGHDPKQCIDSAATHLHEDYTQDPQDNNDDGNENQLAQIPYFALGHVYKFKTKDPVALTQVGVLGSLTGSRVGLVLDGRCQTCKAHIHCVHTRVWNIHNGQDHDAHAPDHLDPEDVDDHPPVSDARSFSMTRDCFETVFSRTCNEDGTGLKLKGWSREPIPFDPAQCSSALGALKFERCMGEIYSDSEGLRDPCWLCVQRENSLGGDMDNVQTDNAGESAPEHLLHTCARYADATPLKPTFLLHPGGVIPFVRVYDSVLHDGQLKRFDGAHAGILRVSETVFLTHELLQEFWDCELRNRLTHRGWILSKITTWTRSVSIVQLDPEREQNRQLVLEFLTTPSLPDLIFDALYDYLELLDVPPGEKRKVHRNTVQKHYKKLQQEMQVQEKRGDSSTASAGECNAQSNGVGMPSLTMHIPHRFTDATATESAPVSPRLSTEAAPPKKPGKAKPEAARRMKPQIKAESDDEIEPYDGSYDCLICTDSVRGLPALACSQCRTNPWHRKCDPERKYEVVCPTCGQSTVQAFKGVSAAADAASEVIDVTGEG